MNEENLIAGCVAGNREAQHELYNKYAAKMLAVCYRYTGDRDVAGDLLHDGFIKVFSSVGSYRGGGSFEGWMRRVFATTALGYLRSNKRFIDEASDDIVIKDDSGTYSSAEDMISDKELLALIAELPQGYRTVLNMYAIEGYSHKEIGEVLGIGESSSRSQYLRAKNVLKKRLGDNW